MKYFRIFVVGVIQFSSANFQKFSNRNRIDGRMHRVKMMGNLRVKKKPDPYPFLRPPISSLFAFMAQAFSLSLKRKKKKENKKEEVLLNRSLTNRTTNITLIILNTSFFFLAAFLFKKTKGKKKLRKNNGEKSQSATSN